MYTLKLSVGMLTQAGIHIPTFKVDMASSEIKIIYAKSVSDLTWLLNHSPDTSVVRVEMGLRFWGSQRFTRIGIPDPDIDDVRDDLQEAIADHPSLEFLIFRGPSQATFRDLAAILEGIHDHETFRSVSLPVVPLEQYHSRHESSSQLQHIMSLLRRIRGPIKVQITDGTNIPEDDSRGKHVDSRKTRVIQRAIDTLIHMVSRNRSSHI